MVVVVALIGCAGAEGEGIDGVGKVGHLRAVDEGLDVAVVVEAVAHGAVGRSGGGHGAVEAVELGDIVAQGGLERDTGPTAGVGTVVADAADADVVVGQTGQACDEGTVGVGGNHARGGSEAGRAVCHLVVVGTVGVPSDGELAVRFGVCGV